MAQINKDGGIYLKDLGKKLPIKIKSMDTESNPTKAAQAATKLILQDEVDLMIVLHTHPGEENAFAWMESLLFDEVIDYVQ